MAEIVSRKNKEAYSGFNLLEFISNVSYRFISSPTSAINNIIDESLEKIGSVSGVDRAYVFIFRGEYATNTNEWCREGTKPLKNLLQEISLKDMPWCIKELNENNIIYVPDVSNLPDTSFAKLRLHDQGIRSVLVLPMMFRNKLLGFLGFDSNKNNKCWKNDEIRFLRLMGDTIINALERSYMEEDLISVNETLKSEIAHATKNLISTNKSLEDEIEERRQAEHALLRRERRLLEQNQFLIKLISGEAVYSRDISESFRIITKGTADIIDAEKVSIWLFDSRKTRLISSCFYNRLSPAEKVDHSIMVDKYPLYFNAIFHGNIIKAGDISKNPITRSFKDPYFAEQGIKSLLDCPIFLNKEVIGVFCVESIYPRKSWTTEDINLVTSLATLISLCIENREKEKTQKELKDSEIKYKLLFDGSVDSIFIMVEDKFLECNLATESMFQCTREEILGRSPHEFSPEYQPDGVLSDVKAKEMIRLANEGEPQTFEWTHTRLDGTPFETEVSLKRLDLNGKVFIQAVVRDITEKRELQKKLLRTQKLESIGKLTGGIAHDFNNILGIIMGYSSILEPRLLSNPLLHKYINSIIKEAQRASDLISKLLVFSRGGVNKFVHFNLNKILLEIAEIIKHTFDKKITLSCSIEEDRTIIFGDYTQMHQVFMNIVLNARDAMPDGGLLTINSSVIKASEQQLLENQPENADYVMVSIRDTGIGMDKKTMEYIFDPFFTTKENGMGTGLGLSAVYGIINSHQGFIDVSSELGTGTCVKILMPISKTAVKEVSVEKQSELILPGNETILVVDDEKEILNLSKDLFSMYGYQVLLANSGNEAIDIYKECRVDLVIMDMMMPGMSGKELFNILRGINPDIKVIFSSGYSEENIMQDIQKADNCKFIQKPFTVRNLLSLVRGFFD